MRGDEDKDKKNYRAGRDGKAAPRPASMTDHATKNDNDMHH